MHDDDMINFSLDLDELVKLKSRRKAKKLVKIIAIFLGIVTLILLFSLITVPFFSKLLYIIAVIFPISGFCILLYLLLYCHFKKHIDLK